MDAAILAGGRARRFGGRDKSALDVGRASIFDRQLAALRGLADRILVVTAEPGRFEGTGVETIADVVPGAGALGGLYTALTAARADHVLVLACDLPFVTAAFLGRLAALAGPDVDAVVPRSRDGWQPLCAVYATSLAPIVRRRIESGDLKITDWLPTLRTRKVGAEEIALVDPDGLLFFNVNSLADLDRANRLVARMSGTAADRRNP